MAQDLTASNAGLAQWDERKLYERAFERARRVLEVQVLSWIEPHEDDWVLPLVLKEAEARLAGCSRAEAQKALGHVVAMVGAGWPSEAVCEGYLMILTRYPKSLLLPSLANAIARERYHKLPTVGALVADAEQELQHKRAKLCDLRTACARLDLLRRWATCRSRA